MNGGNKRDGKTVRNVWDQDWVDGENNRCLAVETVGNERRKRKIGLWAKCIMTGSESRRAG